MDGDDAQDAEGNGRGGDLPKLLQVGQDEQAGQRHAAKEDWHEPEVLEHARGEGVEERDDQCGSPEVVIECKEILSVIKPEMKGHHQAGEQSKSQTGELIARIQDQPKACSQEDEISRT